MSWLHLRGVCAGSAWIPYCQETGGSVCKEGIDCRRTRLKAFIWLSSLTLWQGRHELKAENVEVRLSIVAGPTILFMATGRRGPEVRTQTFVNPQAKGYKKKIHSF